MEIKRYLKPRTLLEAYEVLQEQTNNHVIGGGAWIKSTLKSVETLIELQDLIGTKITETTSAIAIDALCTLKQIEENSGLVQLLGGIIPKSISGIMGVAVRNVATIGGTIVGKYAFSDLITALLAADATLIFYKNGRIRLSDYLQSEDRTRDILLKIELAKQVGTGYFHKVAKTSLDFAIISVAVTFVAGQYRIIIGSRPGIAALALDAMNLLNRKQHIVAADLDAASKLSSVELGFSSNFRGTEEYRRTLAEVYVKRGLLEVAHYAG
jgi:CO/xanthine dehydrogenase FAD-binding subunit